MDITQETLRDESSDSDYIENSLSEQLQQCKLEDPEPETDFNETSTSDFCQVEIEPIIQLKITLKGVSPPIWRSVQVPSCASFEDLHYIIQQAMGWKRTHHHTFFADHGILVDDSTCDYFMECGDENIFKEGDVELGAFFKASGDAVLYEYDPGDGWEHEISLEKFVLTPDPNVALPRCVGGERACPPEECGGPDAYKHLLRVWGNPFHAEYGELRAWLDKDYPKFDPEKFDLQKLD